jgi:AraC-like DNA-binding protein
MQRAADVTRASSDLMALHRATFNCRCFRFEDAWRAAFRSQNAFREQTIKQFWPDLDVLFEWHRPLIDAIAAGDSHAAEDAAIAHLDAVWYRMAETSGDQRRGRDPLFRACAYLAFHFGEAIRLPTLATEVAGCSAGQLARLFRDRQGISFSDYLIEIRMHKAADLLQRTRLDVHRVASRVGYRDPSRFSMHFRRRFGLTPSEFRRRFRLAPAPS